MDRTPVLPAISEGMWRALPRSAIRCVSLSILAIGVGCAQTVDEPSNVDIKQEALTVDDWEYSQPSGPGIGFHPSGGIDLCWAADPDSSGDANGDGIVDYRDPDAIAAKKARVEALVNRWAAGVFLPFRWAANCRAPQNGLYPDTIRIMLDAPPTTPSHLLVPGPAVGQECGPWGSGPYASRNRDCLYNTLIYMGTNDWNVLHEAGHALGFPHEHIRPDTDRECWNWGPTFDVNQNATIQAQTVTEIQHTISGVKKVDVYLNLQHPRPSDLEITVLSPNGLVATIHNHGPSLPKKNWSTDDPEMAGLLAGSYVGLWEVVIRDTVPGPGAGVQPMIIDASLSLAMSGQSTRVENEAIPDSPAQRRLLLNSHGLVTKVYTHVNVDHPRPSDLIVHLRAPDNQAALLHNRASTPLKKSWNTTHDLNVLYPLIASPVLGTWKLTFTDVATGQTGTFDSWRLSLNESPELGGGLSYLTHYDGRSVMHYGGTPGCPASPEDFLSSGDHVGFQLMYPPLSGPPVIGAGIYRDDAQILLESEWTRRGAVFGTPESALSAFEWRRSGTLISSSTFATFGPLAPGDYQVSFQSTDRWSRVRTSTNTVRVMSKGEHTALSIAAGL